MNRRKKIVFALFMLGICVKLLSQNNKVFVKSDINNNLNEIQIKWFYDKIYSEEGFDVLRITTGDTSWIRLNKKPIIKGIKSGIDNRIHDTELLDFIGVMNNVSRKDFEGFLKLAILLKSVQSESFARYLGIQYADTLLDIGNAYIYKVVIHGSEEIVGVSDTIVAGSISVGLPPDSIKIQRKKTIAEITWKPDDESFYAVNIYRRSISENKPTKMNKMPVLIAKSSNNKDDLIYPKTYFTDDSLRDELCYFYSIAGIDYFGEEMKRSEEVVIGAMDFIPPPAPDSVIKQVNGLIVCLKWKMEHTDEVLAYKVYRSAFDRDDYELISKQVLKSNTRLYEDTVPEPHSYYYIVSSVDSVGNESKSRKVYAEVSDIFPPEKPKSLIAHSDTARVVLEWMNNTEQDLWGYLIYRKFSGNKADFSLISNHPFRENYYIDSLPLNSKNEFIYYVLAIDSSYNKSVASEYVGCRMPDVIAPTKPSFRKVVSREIPELYWHANVEPDLIGYNLYRGETAGTKESFVKLNETFIPQSITKYTDVIVTEGVTYFYYLVAFDSSGNQSVESDPCFVSIKKKMVPNPEIQSYKAQFFRKKNLVKLSWEIQNIQNLIGIIVYRKEYGAVEKQLTGLIKSNTYFDEGIPEGLYTYRIKSYSLSGKVSISESEVVQVRE